MKLDLQLDDSVGVSEKWKGGRIREVLPGEVWLA